MATHLRKSKKEKAFAPLMRWPLSCRFVSVALWPHTCVNRKRKNAPLMGRPLPCRFGAVSRRSDTTRRRPPEFVLRQTEPTISPSQKELATRRADVDQMLSRSAAFIVWVASLLACLFVLEIRKKLETM